jgi:hypothetical protein
MDRDDGCSFVIEMWMSDERRMIGPSRLIFLAGMTRKKEEALLYLLVSSPSFTSISCLPAFHLSADRTIHIESNRYHSTTYTACPNKSLC